MIFFVVVADFGPHLVAISLHARLAVHFLFFFWATPSLLQAPRSGIIPGGDRRTIWDDGERIQSLQSQSCTCSPAPPISHHAPISDPHPHADDHLSPLTVERRESPRPTRPDPAPLTFDALSSHRDPAHKPVGHAHLRFITLSPSHLPGRLDTPTLPLPSGSAHVASRPRPFPLVPPLSSDLP